MDGLLRVTAPREWIILAGLGFALAGVVAWSFLGSIERSLAASCAVVQPGERHPVIAEQSSNIVEVLVDVDDEVEAGQPIARVRVAELDHRVALARAKVSALETAAGSAAADLALAQAELSQLEALRDSSEFIVSPLAGAVVAQRLAPGQRVMAGSEVALIMESTGAALEVVSVLTPAQVDDLGVGTEARVLIDYLDGGRTQSVNASVKSITERPAMPPGWLLDYGISAPSRGHWVRLKLDDAPGAPLSDGDPCELHVVLGRHAPVAFLAPRGLN